MGRETNKSRREAQAQTAREKAAAARGDLKRSEQRRRAMAVLSTVVVVALIGGGIAAYALTRPSGKQAVVTTNTAQADTVMSKVANVATATLDSVGIGSVISGPQSITGDPLTQNGKPELLYIGAEFCPYCAGERWAMAVALSRFGALSNVSFTESASNDVDPSTATLDFKTTSYQSKYLDFTPVENEDRNHDPLQSVTSDEDALWGKYSPNGQKGFPFLDFGNQFSISGPSFDPKVLQGLTQAQIADKLSDPADPVSKGILGSANLITATICNMTNNQPATVCGSNTISTIQTQIKSANNANTSSGSSS